MTFLEAIKLLKARKCVRRHKWYNKDYLYYINFLLHRYSSHLDEYLPYDILTLSDEDLIADDWEEVIKKGD